MAVGEVAMDAWRKETTMNKLLLGLVLIVAAGTGPQLAQAAGKAAKKDAKGSAPAADPNVVVSKAHGGKVWIITASPPSGEGEELNKWLSGHSPASEITTKAKEERWPITFLAVFKKASVKGPITIQFVDKKDSSTLVDQYSTQSQSGGLVYQEQYDLDTNNGFNKGHTYVVKVGQIIKNRFVSYSTGEVTLK
jgi:hypothetical protein